ncbi:MAG TPA: translation initiation factor IF-2, partial [Vicinamibacterales bacterium]|nr:translation initiation factor IF-2 [Vicinamibacterales bacterium]
ERQRPRPIVPGAPRPRPVASGSPYGAPRPIASASPGAGTPTRREDRPGAGGARADDRGRGKRGKRGAVDQQAVSDNIFKTMTAIRGAPPRRGGARRADDALSREELEAQRSAEQEREKKTVRVNEFISVSELAEILKIPPTQIVGFALKNLGFMVTINQRLDFDQIELIASEFGFRAVREEEFAADTGDVPADKAEDLKPRPPVVTIMGHVDHGKTSLLDYIRKANVVAGEAGGITQHIGAYHVSLPDGKKLTFLDTPGHEAFTAMRARGAQVTDIVVLVIAADDQVMPQTIEAISHAKNANVPMIVAINKVDLPSANVLKVKQDLLQHGVVLEEFGGTTLSSEISAKTGAGIDALLEQILLQAELLELKANPDRPAVGAVIEASLDAGKGPVATVLVSSGTLRVGDDFICGMFSGRVRALLDERGKAVKEAGPAIPVQVLGMTGVAMAGDQFIVVEDAVASREIAQRRQRLDREARSRRTAKGVVSLEEFMTQTSGGEKRTLRIVIKADQGGPAEAVADALGQLSNDEVSVEVIHRGVGTINESDILLARAAGAIIVGFHVRPDNNARAAAEREGVDIKLYKIIYEAVEDVRLALEGLLRPEEREVVYGEAHVLQLFRVPKIGVIAGCSVRSGIINRQGRVRVIRDGSEVYDGVIGSLRHLKDDVREVRSGFECGIGIENFQDVKVGDVIECYRTEQVARTLTPAATA